MKTKLIALALLASTQGAMAAELPSAASQLQQIPTAPAPEKTPPQFRMVPGASVGASDLIVDVAPGDRLSGSVDADNSGSRYTGAERLGATLNLNNPFGRGDVATLRALSSFDGLSYGRAAYQMQFGRADTGIAYTALDYDLGEEFNSLQAHGTAQIATLYGRLPLLRSRRNNLYAQLNFDAKTFRDKVDVASPAIIADKKAKVSMLSLVGDHHDGLGGGGATAGTEVPHSPESPQSPGSAGNPPPLVNVITANGYRNAVAYVFANTPVSAGPAAIGAPASPTAPASSAPPSTAPGSTGSGAAPGPTASNSSGGPANTSTTPGSPGVVSFDVDSLNLTVVTLDESAPPARDDDKK